MEGLELSGVERKRVGAASTGFDLFEDESVSEFDACLGDDMDLEEDYLEKLKLQRERMQRIERGYQEKQQQLNKQVQRTSELIIQIQRLTAFVPYKQKYDQLKQDYTELLSKHNMQQNQLQIVKQELSEVINQSNGSISRLKNQLKNWKQSSVINANHLQQSLSDREEQVRKLKREFKDKQDQIQQENKSLRNMVNKLRTELQSEVSYNDEEKDKIIIEIKARDNTILDLEKALEQARKLNLDMKTDISKFSEEINTRDYELSSMCNKLKQQLSQNKKTISDKDSKIQELESDLKKALAAVNQLKKQNSQIKAEYKKACDIYESGTKKLRYESDSEIARLETFIKELKTSIEQLMDVKNHLMLENRKLVAILKKKQHSERQRKLLLRTEFKEIDRIQKVIDRLE